MFQVTWHWPVNVSLRTMLNMQKLMERNMWNVYEEKTKRTIVHMNQFLELYVSTYFICLVFEWRAIIACTQYIDWVIHAQSILKSVSKINYIFSAFIIKNEQCKIYTTTSDKFLIVHNNDELCDLYYCISLVFAINRVYALLNVISCSFIITGFFYRFKECWTSSIPSRKTSHPEATWSQQGVKIFVAKIPTSSLFFYLNYFLQTLLLCLLCVYSKYHYCCGHYTSKLFRVTYFYISVDFCKHNILSQQATYL